MASHASLLGDVSPQTGAAIAVVLLLLVGAAGAAMVLVSGTGHRLRARAIRRRVVDGLRSR
jgi:hypothetical protein